MIHLNHIWNNENVGPNRVITFKYQQHNPLVLLSSPRWEATHYDLCVANAPSNHVRWCNLCSLLQLMFAATSKGQESSCEAADGILLETPQAVELYW